MMEVRGLNFSYRCGRQILREISFDAPSGSCLAILGNNGAGKSTLLNCFTRQLRPQSGAVLVEGADLLSLAPAAAARTVALVSQNAQSGRLTVYDTVLLGRKPYMKWNFTDQDRLLVDAALRQLDLEPLALRYADQLSGGEQQKIMLARALVQQPRVLLLDEPTSNLDLRNQYEVLELVTQVCRERGIAAVVVIHDLNLALRFCDRFLLLHNGAVYAHGDASVVNTESLRAVYGVEAAVHRVAGVPMVVPTSWMS